MTDELSPSEVARRLGATTRSVQRWIAAGRLPARRVGGRWRVASDAFDAFVAASGSPEGAGALSRRNAPGEPGARGDRQAITSVFVANRGEIARRIARTCDRLGIRCVPAVTEGPDAVDLLDGPAVVSAALEAGCVALHPGFGFLAESADFAQHVTDAGIVWIGPPPDAIRAMGDKAAARRLARELGVPVVPGYDELDQSDERLRRAADAIGFPVLVKPAGGGGGKGMRVVRHAAELDAALTAARREATAAFRDDRLILERLVEGPRHVEVQVLFDASGHGIHLGERDCSLQRRHQKVLEETPSPAVGPELRARLGGYALALAGAVGYVGAGTCEFLLADDGEVFFLEMNTRLQVEHPVTELVTGRDLVADQLAIATGDPLPIGQDEVDVALARGGHAIEVRLYAEDADAGFLPATGRIARLRWPTGPGIRVDAGIDEGSEISGRFDPMLAKVIAHGSDRAESLGRLRDALDATVVLGLTTNLRFLRWLLRRAEVVAGEARIDTLERTWQPDEAADARPIPESAWLAAARALVHAGAGAEDRAWRGGWRLNAAPRIRLSSGDEERSVALERPGEDAPTGPTPSTPEAARADRSAYVDVDGRSVEFRIAPPPDVDRAARAAAAAHHGAGRVELVAPMPGAVLAVHTTAGAALEAGDPIVTLEAMKMEHIVAAPVAGTLDEVRVRPGDQVARGDLLAVVDP